MKVFFAVATLSAAILLSTAAYSQTCCMGKACGDEVDNLCQPGGDIETCMMNNYAQVSAKCRTYLDTVKSSHEYEKQMEQEKAQEENKDNADDNAKTGTTAKTGDTATTGDTGTTGGANTSGTSAGTGDSGNTGGSGETGSTAATGGYAPTGPVASPGSTGGVNILNGTLR